MLPVGLAITLTGYTLIYFGVSSIRGPGVGLLDLIVPGRFKGGPSSSTSNNVGPMPSAGQISTALAQPGATGANSEQQGPNRKIM